MWFEDSNYSACKVLRLCHVPFCRGFCCSCFQSFRRPTGVCIHDRKSSFPVALVWVLRHKKDDAEYLHARAAACGFSPACLRVTVTFTFQLSNLTALVACWCVLVEGQRQKSQRFHRAHGVNCSHGHKEWEDCRRRPQVAPSGQKQYCSRRADGGLDCWVTASLSQNTLSIRHCFIAAWVGL